MDAKAEFTKIWKDVQASAKEFASYGLSMSSRALDRAATTLKTLDEKLKVQAEKLATKGANGAEPKQPPAA